MSKFIKLVKRISIGVGRFVLGVVRKVKSIYNSCREQYRKIRNKISQPVAEMYALFLKLSGLLPAKYRTYLKTVHITALCSVFVLDIIFQYKAVI